MIHILDTEHPWEVHSISSEHSEPITCLEWDQSGEAAWGPEAHPDPGPRTAEHCALSFLSCVPNVQS